MNGSPPDTRVDESDERAAAEHVLQLELKVTELAHRIKNLLAIVQSVANQTIRDGKTAEQIRATLDQRLGALGRAVDLLQREVSEQVELSILIRTALVSDAERVSLLGPPCVVDPSVVLNLTLIFQELETNSIKYGALSRAGGAVSIEWHVSDATLHLLWSEGGGPPVEQSGHEGTGTRLLRRIARHLRGSFEASFEQTGVRWHLQFPVQSLA